MRRSLLFIPGNNPAMLQNADVFGADGVIFDLEDAVNVTEKDNARNLMHYYLESHQNLPMEVDALPIAVVDALVNKTEEAICRLIKFLPHKKLNYKLVSEKEREIYQNKLEFTAGSAEIQAAFILAVIHTIVDENDLSAKTILQLFSFPDFRSLLFIVSKLVSRGQLYKITEAFAIAKAEDYVAARSNILILINIISNYFIVLCSLKIDIIQVYATRKVICLFKVGHKNPSPTS